MIRTTLSLSWFGLYTGLLLSISAFSIDILLPSVVAISTSLQVPVEQAQFLIPIYMIALGLAHPVYGALSDRVGRRPGILLGLGIFLLGSIACTVGSNIETVWTGRFLQGFGAASAPVLARAMIRDKFSGIELAQNMAIASMFFSLGPMLAPLIGYAFYIAFGWRAVFLFLLGFACLLLVLTWLQEETLPANVRRQRGPRPVVADTIAVFRHRQSGYFMVLACFCAGLILTMLTQAAVIFKTLGATSGQLAVAFALLSTGIIVGQLLNHRLIAVAGVALTTTIAAAVVAIVALLMWICAATQVLNLYVFCALMFTFNLGYLIVYSNIASLAMQPHPQRAGSAAAMFGFTSYIVGSGIAILITLFANERLPHWAACFFALAFIVLLGIAYWNHYLSHRVDADSSTPNKSAGSAVLPVETEK